MIVALWTRWRTSGRLAWLALALGLLAIDALVGARLLSWEIGWFREMVSR